MTDNTFPVSVVICAYNAEQHIEKSLRSICEQTYSNIEILVIDDASTDTTRTIVEKIAKKDARICLVTLTTNKGIAHARQVGLENVCYDWLLFLDADDIALPEMIEKQVQKLTEDSNIIAVSTYAYYCGENDSEILGEQQIGIPSKDEFFTKYDNSKLIFMLVTTLFSRKHAIAVGGYRIQGFPAHASIRYQDFSEDVDLWCRLSDFGGEGKYMITIPAPLFLYRKTVGSLSTGNIFCMQEKMRWIKECLKRRRAGIPEISFEEFHETISFWQRLQNLRADYAAFFFRKMGFCYLQRQYVRTALLFPVVSILDPKFLLKKLTTQKRVR